MLLIQFKRRKFLKTLLKHTMLYGRLWVLMQMVENLVLEQPLLLEKTFLRLIFHVIGIASQFSKKFFLKKEDKILELSGILRISVDDDLVIFTTNGKVTKPLKLSQKAPSEKLYALGYPKGVKQTLIHLKKHGTFDNGYDYDMVVGRTNVEGISGGAVVNRKGELVGVMYYAHGNILRFRKAIKLRELQRGSGLDCSNLSLSSCVEKGIKDFKEKAERPGESRAKKLLGELYLTGYYGVEQNIGEAIRLLSQSVNEGSILARDPLARIYKKQGNLVKALELSLPAANDGVIQSQSLVAQIYLLQEHLSESIEQAVYAGQQAVDWVHKAIEKGSVEATFLLGTMYEFGNSVVNEDQAKALELYKEASIQGDQPSLERLALKTLIGSGGEQSTIKALMIFSQLEEQGYKLSPDTKDILDKSLLGGFACRGVFN